MPSPGEEPSVARDRLSISACLRRALAFGLGYLLCALVGHALSIQGESFVSFWLPAGLYVGVLLLNPTRTWLLFVTAALVGNAAFDLITGQAGGVALLFGLANTAEAVTGAWLVRRFVAVRPRLATPREVLYFVLLAGLLGPVVGAAMGATVVTHFLGGSSFAGTWTMWWSGDVTGVLLIAPVVLSAAEWNRRAPTAGSQRRVAEAVIALAAATATAWVAFDLESRFGIGLKFLVLPLLGWIALRLGSRLTAMAMLLIAVVYAWNGVHLDESDLAIRFSPVARTIFIQLFLAVVSASAAVLAALMTERRAREERLQESEARLRQAQTLAQMGSWRVRFEEGREGWSGSEELSRIWGQPPGTPMTMETGYQRIHSEDREYCREQWAAALKSTAPTEWVHRIVVAGAVKWIHVHAQPHFDATGRLVEVSGTNQDVTLARIAEEELWIEKERADQYFENSAVTMLVLDREGRVGRINQTGCALLGWSRAELVGADWFARCLPQAGREEARRIFAEYVAGRLEPIAHAEGVVVTRSGEERWMLWHSNLLQDTDGAIVGTLGAAEDITAQKRTAAKLQESELRYRTLANSGQALIWTAGLDKNCNYFNQTWLTFTGRALEQEIGDGWVEGVHPDDLARCFGTYAAAFDRRERFSMDYRLRRHDGEYRWIQDDGSPRFDSQGNFLGYIGHCLDVTERKRAEVERAALTQVIERKNQELESLVYVTSHDLRTPLLNIQGFSQRLKIACEALQRIAGAQEWREAERGEVAQIATEQMPRALGFIHASVEKMNRLLDGLLQLSRLGRAGMHPVRLDLDGMLESIRAAMAHQIEEAGAIVEVERLPACEGDATLINQLFTNLLDNAVKYRDPARPLRVQITGRSEGSTVVYTVADNGVGIPPEHLGKIWEVFHRVDPRSPVAGEGLGLNLVRRIVERHQGEIRVESTVGECSRFMVTLPVGGGTGGTAT